MGEDSPGATRKVLAAGVLAGLVAALIWAPRGERPAAVAPGTMAAPQAAGPAPEAAAAVAPESDPAAGEAAPPAEQAAPAEAAEAPGFDLVRVERDGSAVVAGHAEPGASVTILADDEALAEVEADRAGNFVVIFRAEPSAEPRALTLQSRSAEGGTAASDEVVMLLPEPPEAAETDPPAATAGTAVPGAAADAAATTEPAAAEPVAEADAQQAPAEAPEVAATAILRPEGVEVAAVEAEPGPRRVTLASISYAEAGAVTLAGVGTAGARLRAYVDDALAKETTVGPDGRWSMELGEVAAGVYTLRIDELRADGRVASRVETPFQRDFPHAPLPRPGRGPGVSVTVQPGNNLWTLARTHYGSGVMYTQIFTANRELIRDPSLIYPGQIFTLPEIGAAE